MIKIFIINLESCVARKEFMQKQIETLFSQNPKLKKHLEFVFFRAIDAKNDEHLEFQSHFPAWTSYLLGRELSKGEKACFASHYKLWQECVQLNESIIILEDDVLFDENFIKYILNVIQSEFEYVRLVFTFNRKIYPLEENFYISFENVNGTQGYFLKPSAALKFINHSKFWIKAVDDTMDMCYFNGVLNIAHKPFLLKLPDENDTTIAERNIKPKGLKKITRELFRIYCNFRKSLFKLSMKKKLKLS